MVIASSLGLCLLGKKNQTKTTSGKLLLTI